MRMSTIRLKVVEAILAQKTRSPGKIIGKLTCSKWGQTTYPPGFEVELKAISLDSSPWNCGDFRSTENKKTVK